MSSWRTKVNKFPEMKTRIKNIGKKSVTVGCLNGEHARLASIHEYGCEICITEKMRKWLHANGLHVKDTTTVIKIPERAFLRNGHDENIDRILNQTERALGLVVSGEMSVDDMLDLCGQQLATAIKTYMRDLSSPPNHPFTKERKGSSNPLIDTGGLLESITWKRE